MKWFRHKVFWIVVFSMLNGGLMVLFTFWLMSLPYVHEDEQALIENLSKTKNIWLGLEKKPDREKFIFINVAFDQQLIPNMDADGFEQGKQAITDRHLLARFLHILNQKPDNQPFILCDISFPDSATADACSGPSPDSALAAELAQTKNILVSQHLSGDGSLTPNIFKAPAALADYQVAGETFFKFQLIYHDTLKTMPLRMYEMITGKTARYNGWWIEAGDNHFFNYLIPDFHIRQFNLLSDTAQIRYKTDNLSNILSGAMTDKQVLDYVKGRMVIIGDFENKDVHQTIYGDTGGTLILLNTFLALQNGDNRLTFGYLIFLWLAFTAISSFVLTFHNPAEQLKEYLETKKRFLRIPVLVREAFFEAIGYPLLLLLLSMSSFLLFRSSISILYLSVWLFLLRQAVLFRHKKLFKE
jgi:hypothetical protein